MQILPNGSATAFFKGRCYQSLFLVLAAVVLQPWMAFKSEASVCVQSAAGLRGKSLRFTPASNSPLFHSSGSYEVFFAAEGDTYMIAPGEGFPAAYGRWELDGRFLRLSDFPVSDGRHFQTSTTLNCDSGVPYETVTFGNLEFSGFERGDVEFGTGVAPVLEGLPAVATQPVATEVLQGGTVTFSVVATGAEPLKYQWYRGGSPLLVGGNAASLVITNALPTDAFAYSVKVSNASGSAMSVEAQLTVNSAPKVDPLPEYAGFVGQNVTLGVVPQGTQPFSFQWNFNDTPIADGAIQFLTFTNLAFSQAGQYSVTVSNRFGVTTTSNTTLHVFSLPVPSLSFGDYSLSFGDYQTTNRLAHISIPVFYSAQGTETNLSFSFAYDPAVLTNASFDPVVFQTICSCSTQNLGASVEFARLPEIREPVIRGPVGGDRSGAKPAYLAENTQVYLNTTQSSTGRLGVRIELPAGQVFAPEYSNHIGYLLFKLVPGVTNPYAGRVVFANAPEPLAFGPTNSFDVPPRTNPLLPLWTTGTLALNRQSGLIEQTLDLTNPGDLLSNVRLFVRELGVDSRTNAVRLQNAIGSTLIGATSYALVDLGGVGPGETRRFTLEYYASDRRPTSVSPTLYLRAVPPAVVTPTGTTLSIDNYRYTNGVFLVEFPTRTGFRYYIQYAPGLSGTNAPEFKTSLPPVFGTGSYVQWLDNGPPKTESLPTNGMRLYRLIETR